MNYIERPEYMQRLLDLMGTPDATSILQLSHQAVFVPHTSFKDFLQFGQSTFPKAIDTSGDLNQQGVIEFLDTLILFHDSGLLKILFN